MRLRRAQALATTNQAVLLIVRELMAAKLQGQASVLERLPVPERKGRGLDECLRELAESDSIERIRRIEGEFALMYWRAWHGVPVRFAAHDAERVPEHWLTFGQRYSLLSKPSPRRAVNPANAILNYLYAIIEAEAQIAALRMGLDPGLGLLHVDQRTRNSLPCDLMEPVRPKVDAYVFDLFRDRSFKTSDFFETREGICRLMPSLAHELSETSTLWAKQLAPVTERVAQMLFTSTGASNRRGSSDEGLPTPLTGRNRSEGRRL